MSTTDVSEWIDRESEPESEPVVVGTVLVAEALADVVEDCALELGLEWWRLSHDEAPYVYRVRGPVSLVRAMSLL